MNSDVTKTLEHLFPELKESEDERIRKNLKLLVENYMGTGKYFGIEVGKYIAWLENQDKKVDVIENFDTEFEKQVSHLLASIINKDWEYTEGFVKWVSNSLLGYAKHEIEKQGEQKPAWSEEDERNLKGVIDEIEANKNAAPDYDLATYDRFLSWLKSLRPQGTGKPQGKSALEASNESVDKIEPRFKVGDWVVANYSGKIGQVVAVSEDGYGYQLNDGLCFGVSWCDIFHLWNIKNDANDGDVLQLGKVTVIFKELIGHEHCKCYCSICNGELEIPSQDGADNDYGCYNAAPATKEQWDTLRSKMKEAGYEWDSENKKVQTIMKIRKYE